MLTILSYLRLLPCPPAPSIISSNSPGLNSLVLIFFAAVVLMKVADWTGMRKGSGPVNVTGSGGPGDWAEVHRDTGSLWLREYEARAWRIKIYFYKIAKKISINNNLDESCVSEIRNIPPDGGMVNVQEEIVVINVHCQLEPLDKLVVADQVVEESPCQISAG